MEAEPFFVAGDFNLELGLLGVYFDYTGLCMPHCWQLTHTDLLPINSEVETRIYNEKTHSGHGITT